MTISSKTRKILWGRSGNRCAYCKCLLVEESKQSKSNTVVGDECHIVATSDTWSRGVSDKTPQERDAYENLILLCKIHHKMIDDQSEIYTVDTLHKLKNDHEKWVRESLEPPSKNSSSIKFISLPHLTDAKQIVNILASASSHHTDYETPRNEEELAVLMTFIGEFEDLSILSDESLYLAEATFRIQVILNELENIEYYVYGKLTKGKLTLQSDSKTVDWKHGFIVMKRFKVPQITIGYDPDFRF